MRARWLLGSLILLTTGCGSAKYVPVSGKVTLDGKPLANAHVNFQPVPDPGSGEPAGPGSNGTTDAKGKFTLKATTGEDGAVVGKHRVYVSTPTGKAADDDSAPKRGGQKNKVPSKYGPRGKKPIFIEVPPGGTDKADIVLKR
jgi:hypothetical protein